MQPGTRDIASVAYRDVSKAALVEHFNQMLDERRIGAFRNCGRKEVQIRLDNDPKTISLLPRPAEGLFDVSPKIGVFERSLEERKCLSAQLLRDTDIYNPTNATSSCRGG